MATLLRTRNTSASKLIAGFYPPSVSPPQVPPANLVKKVAVRDPCSDFLTFNSLQTRVSDRTNASPHRAGFSLAKGINVTSLRHSSTDIKFPDFTQYRHEISQDPEKSAAETKDDRRALNSAITYAGGGAITLVVGKEVAQRMVVFKAMAADMKAMASTEINLSEVPIGKTKTFEWRGKPIFVKHRTPEEIERESSVNVSELRHPEEDHIRCKKPEWSVVIGVCTHLGCIPIANSGEFGGYLCPCHGSHYDGSGRIRKGPAPLNLSVPDYVFKGDDTIVVGVTE